ncbi:MAG: methylaspartate mutase accessory protein GlmL [Porphyromonas sp.]|nr:methylaspartate mutase accessory protein GlmL [Porphyromonas sp.]
MRYLTADFGSTYTKVTAIDTELEEIIGTGAAFTTIETDVMEGLNNAMANLRTKIGGEWQEDRFLCCSSAAGGLKMVACGLVPELTAKAAKMAASSAGAKVVKTFAYELSRREATEIEEIDPDLILLCGGTDGGNRDVVIKNAETLSKMGGDFTIVVACNKNAEEEVSEILSRAGRAHVVTDNVMPSFDVLNIEPAKSCIMQLFIDQIIDAKGLSQAQEKADNEIIPTPLAVLNACNLLSVGTHEESGVGDLLAVDLGGATTDVYSMAKGEPTMSNMMQRGLPEPFSKRTVEGDLGMRYSLTSLAEELDLYKSGEEVGMSEADLREWVSLCATTPSTRATTPAETMMEMALARGAVKIAVERHVGKMKSTYTPMGQVYALYGKDLTQTEIVIGIGGALVYAKDPQFILEGAVYDAESYDFAKPKSPKFFLDSSYIMASMGLLSQEQPEVALRIMKKQLQQVDHTGEITGTIDK